MDLAEHVFCDCALYFGSPDRPAVAEREVEVVVRTEGEVPGVVDLGRLRNDEQILAAVGIDLAVIDEVGRA